MIKSHGPTFNGKMVITSLNFYIITSSLV
jgi:hypothetical protein